MMLYENAIVLSGEGLRGTFERHTGRPTLRAINRRLNRERCSGDRWAKAFIPAGSNYAPDTYIEIDANGYGVDYRCIPESAVD